MTPDGAGREAELRSYLLGTLPPAQAEEIDEQLIADAEFHAELQATADDLIHAYLEGELTPGDRERFKSHFLASSRQRERVVFVRDLVAAVGRSQPVGYARLVPSAPTPRARLVSMLPWAAALAVGLAAGGWGIGERRLREREAAAAQQREEALRLELAAQDERAKERDARALAALQFGDITTRDLQPGVERGQDVANTITVSGKWVRLRLRLDPDPRPPFYRASLQTPEGREVFGARGLPAAPGREGPTVEVMIPAELLRPGAYMLSILRDGGDGRELTAATFVVR